MAKTVEDLVLPSGKILHREKLPNGVIRTVIPADAADEYGKYVFDRGNAAARRLSNGK